MNPQSFVGLEIDNGARRGEVVPTDDPRNIVLISGLAANAAMLIYVDWHRAQQASPHEGRVLAEWKEFDHSVLLGGYHRPIRAMTNTTVREHDGSKNPGV
jgi:hypothetical protein